MGIYAEYIDQNLSFQEITNERKKQLKKISALRGTDVLVYAADSEKAGQAQIAIVREDLLPIKDQLSNLSGHSIDVLLETPGGSGEVAEDIVRLLRTKYDSVSFIVPGRAMSAGTIIVMAGGEILMDSASSLGPIDAQISWEGKAFSAEALIKGFEKIKEEVDNKGSLNRAYIPMLQRISPGELQHAQNALDFSKVLVTDWLKRYKFKSWATHSSTGKPVTGEERVARAREIADELCNHSRWLTHSRSIKLEDLENLGLKITDFAKNNKLADAIRRFEVLLTMTFASNIYKVFETPTSQIYRQLVPQVAIPGPQPGVKAPSHALMGIKCGKCGKTFEIQADFGKKRPLKKGAVRFPKDDKLTCNGCGTVHDLSAGRREIEARAKAEVIRE